MGFALHRHGVLAGQLNAAPDFGPRAAERPSPADAFCAHMPAHIYCVERAIGVKSGTLDFCRADGPLLWGSIVAPGHRQCAVVSRVVMWLKEIIGEAHSWGSPSSTSVLLQWRLFVGPGLRLFSSWRLAPPFALACRCWTESLAPIPFGDLPTTCLSSVWAWAAFGGHRSAFGGCPS